MEALKTEFLNEAWDNLLHNFGTLSRSEMNALGFINEHLPPWQQDKMIDSPYRTTDTLAKIKASYMLGLNHQTVARFTGISSKTLTRWRQKSQELCLLIAQWGDYTEIIAKYSFYRLIVVGEPRAVMNALRRHDPRYQKRYQDRCVQCKKLILNKHEHTEQLRNSILYAMMKDQQN